MTRRTAADRDYAKARAALPREQRDVWRSSIGEQKP